MTTSFHNTVDANVRALQAYNPRTGWGSILASLYTTYNFNLSYQFYPHYHPYVLELARKLAENYNNRKLVKCVFEKVMQRKDRVVEKIFSQKRFRNELIGDIARQAKVDATSIYVDVPTTPSVPHTYTRQALNSITLVSEDFSGKHSEKISITELPLVGSITGFTDVLRVYSLPEQRNKVARAVQTIFGREELASRIGSDGLS